MAAKFKIKLADEEILNIIEPKFTTANEYYTDELQPKIEKWTDQYNASEEYYEALLPHLSESSKYRSTDVRDTIEFLMPDCMKIFHGSNEAHHIKGRTAEDKQSAQMHKKLMNFQVNSLNHGFLIDYIWIKDSLKKGIGIQKGSWVREYETHEYEYYMNYEQLMLMMKAEMVEVTEYKQMPAPSTADFYVKFKLKKMIVNQPKLENVDIEDFRYITVANSMEVTTAFHIMDKTVDYLRREEEAGRYKDTKKVIENNDRDTTRDDDKRRSRNETSSGYVADDDQDEPSRLITIYECYTKIDVNKDGLLEDVIVTYCGDTILRIQENTYGIIPFFILPGAAIESGRVNGSAIADGIGQIQDMKTAMRKMFVITVNETNHQRKFIPDDGIYLEDIEDNSEFVRYDINRFPRIQDAIGYEPQKPMHAATFKLFEMLEADKEQKSGMNQFKMGLDNKVSNKAYNTATGAHLLAQASNARVDMMAKIMAHTGFKHRAEWLLESNQKFITQEQVVRLGNEHITVRPDDLSGKVDYEVSSGIGTGTAEQTLQQMQMIMELSTGVLLKLGLSDPMKIRNIAKTMIEAMGHKDIDSYLPSEEEMQKKAEQNVSAMQLLKLIQAIPPQIMQAIPPELKQQFGLIAQKVQAESKLLEGVKQPEQNRQPADDTVNRAMAMLKGRAA